MGEFIFEIFNLITLVYVFTLLIIWCFDYSSFLATGLEKVRFHSNPKAGQCQRMFRLPHNCTHLTCQQGNAQNPSSQASIVREPTISGRTSWIQKRQRKQRSNCQIYRTIEKAREFKKQSTSASLTMLKPLAVWIIANCGKFFERLEQQTTLPVS